MDTQEIKPDMAWLYGQGWTLGEAARMLQVDAGHLSRVLRGVRESKRLMIRVACLPKKKLGSLRRSRNVARNRRIVAKA